MRKLTFAMNLSLDGYIAAPGDDLGWSVPSDELFQWWSDRVGATGLALYGRKLWETMSSHWPTADKQPGATPAAIEFASRWRDMPKVVFSSTTSTVDWNTRLVTGDAVTEITRLKADDGGPMDIGGATLAAAAMRAGLIDEYAIVTHPVLVGGGTPFFLTATIAPQMAERGDGAIVNLGSWVARLGIPISSLYSSTKGALETLTRAWAAEFGPSGVRVNAISPGVTRATIPEGADPAGAMMRGTPAGASGAPDAIAHAAVYLASDEAAFVHGTVVDVDGGRVGVAVIAA